MEDELTIVISVGEIPDESIDLFLKWLNEQSLSDEEKAILCGSPLPPVPEDTS